MAEKIKTSQVMRSPSFRLGIVISLLIVMGFGTIIGSRGNLSKKESKTLNTAQINYYNEAKLLPVPTNFLLTDGMPSQVCSPLNSDCVDPSTRVIYEQNTTLNIDKALACETFLKWGIINGQNNYYEKVSYDPTGHEAKQSLTNMSYPRVLASCFKALTKQETNIGYAPVLLGSTGSGKDRIESSLSKMDSTTWNIETMVGNRR